MVDWSRTSLTRGRLAPAAVLTCILLLGLVVLHKAWVTDDAYITFRSVQNFVEGRGLTWNPGERVQVFTHPLWMLAMSAAHAMTREFFYTSLALNVALTLAAVWILAFRLAASWQTACLGTAVLIASRAFTDFSTSGLENPLAHFLVVVLLLQDRPGGAGAWHRVRFSLVAGLCLLTRPDTLFLILPAWAVFVWRTRRRRTILDLLLGLAPVIAWEAFSLVYYGSFLPNTAYAKLDTGIAARELWVQGGHYLVNSLYWDPLTLAVTILGGAWAAVDSLRARRAEAAAPAARPPGAPWAWCLGVGLMLIYVASIGGDFMSGRFLTVPLVVGVALLVSRPLPSRVALAGAIAVLLLLLVPWTTPFRDRHYGTEWHAAIDPNGIADERVFYVNSASLRASWNKQGEAWPDPRAHGEAQFMHRHWPSDVLAGDMLRLGELRPEEGWPPQARHDASGRPYRKVFLRGAVGFLGYHLGPAVHVMDYHGICDPLLARLPATVPDPILARLIPRLGDNGWRVGHYYRRPPLGYVRSLALDRNAIADPDLARYYDVIRTVTRDPLFDRNRLVVLLKLRLGGYDDLLRRARESYREQSRRP